MLNRSKPFTYAKRAIEDIKPDKQSHCYPDIDADKQRLLELGNTYRGIPEDKWPDPIQEELQKIAHRYRPITWRVNPSC